MRKQLLNLFIAKYCDLSVSRRSIICLGLRLQQIIDLLATDKSQYYAQPRPAIVKYNINIITGRTRNANNSSLQRNHVCTSLFRDSFFNHIVPLWNNISVDIPETEAPCAFNDHLFSYFFNKFIAKFDT